MYLFRTRKRAHVFLVGKYAYLSVKLESSLLKWPLSCNSEIFSNLEASH